MKFLRRIDVTLLAVLGLVSTLGASSVAEKRTDAISINENNMAAVGAGAIAPPPSLTTKKAVLPAPSWSDRPTGYPGGPPAPTTNAPPPLPIGKLQYDGHNYTQGAAMQWCKVKEVWVSHFGYWGLGVHRGSYDKIEIWGRNWPESDVGRKGEHLKESLKYRIISGAVEHWQFKRCKNEKYCDRGFQWYAKFHSISESTQATLKMVENAINDYAPKPDQAVEIGKGPGNDLCSGEGPDRHGRNEGRWESHLIT